MTCAICGAKDDLFAAVVQQPACSICVIAFGLRTPIQQADIDKVRAALQLGAGDYLKIDRGKAAAALLGRS